MADFTEDYAAQIARDTFDAARVISAAALVEAERTAVLTQQEAISLIDAA